MAESYDLAMGDSTVDARLAAVDYIAAAWDADSDAFKVNARVAVAGMTKPVEQAVVDAAQGVSVFTAWHRADPRKHRPAPHASEWYERVVRENCYAVVGGADAGHHHRARGADRGTLWRRHGRAVDPRASRIRPRVADRADPGEHRPRYLLTGAGLQTLP